MSRWATPGRATAARHPLLRALARLAWHSDPVLRADFYRAMGFMLGAGHSETEALRSILLAEGREGRVPSAVQVALPEFLYRLDARGEDWQRILADWVPGREALAFATGAALTPKRLEDLARDIDRRAALLRSARAAALPFAFAVVFVAATLYGLGAYLFPEFERIGIAGWSGPVAALRGVSLWFAANWWAVAIAAGVGVALYAAALPRLTGRWRRRLRSVLPGAGVYRLAVGLDWLSAMANLMQANIRHLDACRLMRPGASPYLRARLDAVLARPAMPLADALAASDPAWPSRRLVRLLAIITHSDQPFDAIRAVIDQEIAGLDRRIRVATETVNAATQLVMIAFVVFLLLLTFQLSSQPLA